MSDFNTSKIDGNTLQSIEWNQLADVDNFVISSSQTPSTSNLDQLAIASARYSSGGQFFTDSGTANAYVLTPVSPFKSPVSVGAGEGYFNGMTIMFRAGNANSGASTVNVNGAGVKNLKKTDGTNVATGDILTSVDVVFRYDGTDFIKLEGINPATTTIQGKSYLPKNITIANNVASPNDTIDFGAGTYITSTGNQIYLPAISKKIQASGSWTAGTGQNGLDTGARAINTFYRTYIIQNNSTRAYDILFSSSGSSPTIPSGYSNLGLLDYALIRVNGSNNIATAKWDANDKRLVLGSSEIIQVFSSVAGSGNATIVNTTEPLEMQIRVSLTTSGAGGSDISVYGSEHNGNDGNDTVQATTNNGFSTSVGFSPIYTSNGTIYWKNFATAGGILNQTCKLKSIKIRS
jgi:hypothetical protein